MSNLAATLPNDSTLTMREVRAIFRRNRGAAARLARELDVNEASVSRCLRGKRRMPRVERAALVLAAQLLEEESAQEQPAA